MLGIFRSSKKGSVGRIFVWILLGLLAVGLAGFTLSDVARGIAGQNVLRVGNERVSIEQYTRRLDTALQIFSRQLGIGLTMSQARSFGLPDTVLAQLATETALDREAAAVGLSAGDEAVTQEILSRPGFGGADGFDPETYRSALRRSGYTVPEYEAEVRREIARTLLEAGISGGVVMPAVAAETLLGWEREARDFSYLQLTPAQSAPQPQPDDTTLRAFYAENRDTYVAPEMRRIAYAALTPADLAASFEPDEDALRAAYDAAGERFSTPERRIIDRLAFPDEAAATAARARIDAGEIDLEGLAAERGLDAGAIALGPVQPRDLDASSRSAVFAADGPGIVGPVTTTLGPALFRVNAILAGRETSFEDARADLATEVAEAEAAREIDEWIEPVEDLLAAGAPLEDVADETAFVFGTVDVFDGAMGLGADPAFARTAQAAEEGDFPELFELETGGLAALRLEEIVPPAPRPFEEVEAEVRADWQAETRRAALRSRGEALLSGLQEGRTLETVAEAEGLGIFTETGRARRDVPDGLTAEVIAAVFASDPGEVALIGEGDLLFLLRVDGVTAFDPGAEGDLVEAQQIALSRAAALDLLEGFAAAVQADAGVTVNETLVMQILAQYP